ncbi:MAG: FAD-binding protein, partial [Spirochaetia bacterium]|nr:FAD-binding protein [Spirochaetia bacterium]
GINAVIDSAELGDSIESHIEDTLKGGCYIAGENAVRGLCESAPDIIRWLVKLGTVFTTETDGSVCRRAFGGQSHKRTCYCGSATGKQIVTALVMEARRYEGLGLIKRRLWMDFYSALIQDGVCYGALLYNEATGMPEIINADSVVIATGGQNALFGKTTGSKSCDGYAAGRLFMQGVELKNLEFIQYHPTTMATDQKMMLVSEAARGEGGRLYYEENGKRVYFMEDKFGKGGNLMPRDIVSRCIEETGREVFLDITFLGKNKIMKRLPEVYELCMKYRGIDVSKDSIPVSPAVHFFMGGIAVKNNHETNISNLYAIGECASIYHGANRLGGNSLLAAIYGGKVAAASIENRTFGKTDIDFSAELNEASSKLQSLRESKSTYPVMYIRDMLAETMQENLGIARTAGKLDKGLADVSFYLSVADKIHYDSSELAYFGYSLPGILALAKATLICAKSREESRGAHYRKDFPETKEEWKAATLISYDDGAYRTYLDTEGKYEN